MVFIKFTDSATLLAGVTGFLYSSSTAYIHGYFHVLGLDSDVLDRNFHQIIYHGMILNIWSILTIPLFIALSITAYSGFIILSSEYFHSSFKNKRSLVKLRNIIIKRKKRKSTQLEILHKQRVKKSWGIFIIAFGFMFSMALFEKKGKEQGQTVLENIKGQPYSVIKQKNGSNELIYLYCGARNCAGKNLKTNEIEYFPQNGHTSTKYKK